METLTFGNYYHIYNRGINSCDLFTKEEDYKYFLNLYDKYITPVAETYAWVLMPNHFHLLVRIKENLGYKYSYADKSDDAVRFENNKWETIDLSACEAPDSVKLPKPQLHFSHLFNAYTKYFNKRNNRNGPLFERSFKRKQIENEKYLKQVLLYIHNNPVHHGFCEHPMEYGWSSYLSCISLNPTKLHRDNIIGWFDDFANFKAIHNQQVEIKTIEKLLEL